MECGGRELAVWLKWGGTTQSSLWGTSRIYRTLRALALCSRLPHRRMPRIRARCDPDGRAAQWPKLDGRLRAATTSGRADGQPVGPAEMVSGPSGLFEPAPGLTAVNAFGRRIRNEGVLYSTSKM